jgi:AcrR family transcriptional regulator
MSDEPRRGPGRPKDPTLEPRRREQILAAAAEIFARDGYANADLQAVADELGVGKGTLYRYFASKRELFRAVVDRGVQEMAGRINTAFDSSDDPVEKFRRAIHAYLGYFDENPHYVELFIQERATFRDRVPAYFAHRDAKEMDRKGCLMQEMIASGRFRDLPIPRVFDVVGDLLYGTIFTNYLTGRKRPLEQQVADVLDIVFYGLLSDGERREQRRREGK